MSNILNKGVYENNNANLVYVGTWGSFVKQLKSYVYSEIKGDSLSFSFSGTGFNWYTHTNAWRGYAQVYIDSVKVQVIDCYSESEVSNVKIYSSNTLENSIHTVKIEVMGEGRKSAQAYKVAIGEIEILEEITQTEDECNEEVDKKVDELKTVLLNRIQDLTAEIELLKEEVENFNV